jgi:hypothetical protein
MITGMARSATGSTLVNSSVWAVGELDELRDGLGWELGIGRQHIRPAGDHRDVGEFPERAVGHLGVEPVVDPPVRAIVIAGR